MGYTVPHHDIIINDPALTEHGFTRFSLPLNGNGITSMMVVHNTDNSKIIYCHFYKSDLNKSVTALEEKLFTDGLIIDDATADNLVRYFRNECVLLSEDEGSEFFKNGNGKGGSKKQRQQQGEGEGKKERKRPNATYKYSAKGNDILYEAILLAGQPVFVKYNDDSKIRVVQNVEEPTRILKPPNSEEYPYDPYEFVNIGELQSYINKATKESIDSLYQKAKSIVQKYNDQDQHKLTLLAAEVVWSYFQDKFSTTHYVVIVGLVWKPHPNSNPG